MSAKAAILKIESIQNKLTSTPFDYSFVDEKNSGNKFKSEQRIGKLASLFAVVAIFISCLGLFGLSSFIAEQKTKEIGYESRWHNHYLSNIWSFCYQNNSMY